MTAPLRPRSILIAALGGEGGGVLADWIVQAALRTGLPVQATSVPGVAQRTGATSYYIEYLPEPALPGRQPVFALMPVPGCVDTVLSSELLEGVRMIERGFVTPGRTCLITADHRVLTTAEKMAMGDGRFDDARLLQTARASSSTCLTLDLNGITARHRTVVSAVMFGALAGAGRLPWPRAVCEQVIRDAGVGVPASLAGFGQAFEVAALASMSTAGAAAPTPTRQVGNASSSDAVFASAALDRELAQVVALGAARCADYQDADYERVYRDRVTLLMQHGMQAAVVDAARHLALWMTYEDVIRVADLKTRRERFDRVRQESGASADDLLEIHEHLKPGLEEIAAIAPVRLGCALRRLAQRSGPSTSAPARGRGITLHTTSIRGFAMLRLLAALRPMRPRSLRYNEEHAAMQAWLNALQQALPLHAGFAQALAELPRLRKGYGDTFERGRSAYERIDAASVQPWLGRSAPPSDAAAAALNAAILAALADPEHQLLGSTLNDGVVAKPIVFHPRVSKPAQTVASAP